MKNLYCAIPDRHLPGQWMVARLNIYGDFIPLGAVRKFSDFAEANLVAWEISRGKYPDCGDPGDFLNMR